MLFSHEGEVLASHQLSLQQHYPEDGWVEHDAIHILDDVLTCCREVLAKANILAQSVSALGISNQRETTVVWNKDSGQPIHRAIVWQDRRTADLCDTLSNDDTFITQLREKTGLLLDPYFSATKIHWLLTHINGARKRAEQGQLLFGTIDTFLLWHLTGGAVHATDATNASRTLLFNIHTQSWDQALLDKFDIPVAMLPRVEDSAAYFGDTLEALFGAAIPITGIAGDQQAALIGQACFKKGMVKSTYGSGCFLLMNTGRSPAKSSHHLLTTIAYRLNGVVTYGLEGCIFNAGTAIKWLKDNLALFDKSQQTELLARSANESKGLVMVPAFTGLGAPYWDANARGAILGITRDTGIAELVRAALDSVCFQTRDLFEAMKSDTGCALSHLRVDGGMVANQWLMQALADMLNLIVDRPTCIETSAMGAAYLAGLGIGLYQSLDDVSKLWQKQQSFSPSSHSRDRDARYAHWQASVRRIMT